MQSVCLCLFLYAAHNALSVLFSCASLHIPIISIYVLLCAKFFSFCFVLVFMCNFAAKTAPVPAHVTTEMRKRKVTNQIISLLKEQQRKMYQRNAKILSELSLARKGRSSTGTNRTNGISNNMAHGQASGKAIKSFKSSVLCTLRCSHPDNVLRPPIPKPSSFQFVFFISMALLLLLFSFFFFILPLLWMGTGALTHWLFRTEEYKGEKKHLNEKHADWFIFSPFLFFSALIFSASTRHLECVRHSWKTSICIQSIWIYYFCSMQLASQGHVRDIATKRAYSLRLPHSPWSPCSCSYCSSICKMKKPICSL